MAYTQFEDGEPDATITGVNLPTKIADQLEALQHGLVALALYGWNYSITVGTGTNQQPQYQFYKKGTLWIRKTLTWGTSGGADGNITQAVLEYSTNSGSDYSSIGTVSYTYDSDGICTASTWS